MSLHFTHKAFWFTAGVIALIFGVVGIFLPILPTTPFLLITSACFMRASPKLHKWLTSHPYFGPPIVEWNKSKTIKKSIKNKAMIMIVISFILSIALAPILWVKVLLLVLGITLVSWFSTIPTS